MKPDVSIPVALASGAVVLGVYQTLNPNAADVRTVGPGSRGDEFLESTERQAFIVSVAAVAAISLIARDPVPFWIGGGIAVALSWAHRYNRVVDPATNRLAGARASSLQGSRYTVEVAG